MNGGSMKKIIFSSLLLFFLFSCGFYGHREQSKQISNECYLSFTGNLENVSVAIDEAEQFFPIKNNESFSSDNLYKISPGNHRIQVYKNDKLIIDEKFYLGSQETKKVEIL
jgi:hypothetical protein